MERYQAVTGPAALRKIQQQIVSLVWTIQVIFYIHSPIGRMLWDSLMSTFSLYTALYLIIAAYALIMTYLEQNRRKVKSPVFVLAGFGLCFAWPLLIVAVIYSLIGSEADESRNWLE